MSLIFQAIDWYASDINIDHYDDETVDDKENVTQLKYLIKIFGRDINGDAISINIMQKTSNNK